VALVLVVEDEVDLSGLLCDQLRGEGHEVRQAFDGRTALRLVEEAVPDLVILDWMLPDLDGLTVCRRLREGHLMPIIMLTARSEEVDRVLGLEVGADDYVPKELVGVRVTAPFEVSADEGDMSLDSVSVESSLTVRTSLGNVDFRGRVGRAGTLQVMTVSGNVDLTVPAATDARAVVRHRGGNVSWDPVWHFGSRTVGGGQAWVGDLSSSPTGRIAVSCGFGNVSINAA
jgi:CheY-like chemotaxis protein